MQNIYLAFKGSVEEHLTTKFPCGLLEKLTKFDFCKVWSGFKKLKQGEEKEEEIVELLKLKVEAIAIYVCVCVYYKVVILNR